MTKIFETERIIGCSSLSVTFVPENRNIEVVDRVTGVLRRRRGGKKGYLVTVLLPNSDPVDGHRLSPQSYKTGRCFRTTFLCRSYSVNPLPI